MRLPRMDMNKTLNWRFLHLASLNLHAQMAAVAVLATIKYMAVRLRQLTQYLRTQHSLSCHDGTKTAIRYFLFPSRYHHPILRDCRRGRQHHAHQQVAYRSGVNNRWTQQVNRQLHDSDDTQKQARPGDKPIRINLVLLQTHRAQATLFCSPRQDNLWSAKRLKNLATLHSHHH
jgi:hypothetical protein